MTPITGKSMEEGGEMEGRGMEDNQAARIRVLQHIPMARREGVNQEPADS